MKLDKIIKLIMSLFLILITGSVGSFMLKNKIESEAKKIYETRSMLQVLENRDENYALLKADHYVVQEGLPFLRKALPREDNLGDVVARLDALAVETNNNQSLIFDPLELAQGIEGMKIINFSASLGGNFGSFENYFKKLGKLPYYIEIASISINNSEGIFNNNSRLNFKAKLYIKN